MHGKTYPAKGTQSTCTESVAFTNGVRISTISGRTFQSYASSLGAPSISDNLLSGIKRTDLIIFNCEFHLVTLSFCVKDTRLEHHLITVFI